MLISSVKMPSSPPAEHILQGACDQKASKVDQPS